MSTLVVLALLSSGLVALLLLTDVPALLRLAGRVLAVWWALSVLAACVWSAVFRHLCDDEHP